MAAVRGPGRPTHRQVAATLGLSIPTVRRIIARCAAPPMQLHAVPPASQSPGVAPTAECAAPSKVPALPDDEEGALSAQLSEARASRVAAEEAGVFGAVAPLHRLGVELSSQLRALRASRAPPPHEMTPEEAAEELRGWAAEQPTSTLEIVVRVWAEREGVDLAQAPLVS